MSLRFLAWLAFFCLLGPTAFATIQVDAYVTASQGGFSSNKIVSPSFSTSSSNELILAFIATGFNKNPNSFVKGVTGDGLTWTLVKRVNTQRGSAEIWKAIATQLVQGGVVRANLSQKLPASITVMSFTGVDPANPIGAIAGNSAPSGLPSVDLVTTQRDSFVIALGVDGARAISRTPEQNQVIYNQFLASGSTFWLQGLNGLVPQAGTSVRINDLAPDGGPFNFSAVEVIGTAVPNPFANVSGNVSDAAGSPLAGAQVNISGGSGPLNATTDSSGNFNFPSVENGNYVVSVSFSGYSFEPQTQDVTVNGSDVTGVNFVGSSSTPVTHSISGTISSNGGGLAGVSVSLSGQAGSFAATTNTSGQYVFSDIPDGDYTVTPTLGGHTFNPTSQNVSLNGSDRTGINFSAASLSFTVSGTITIGSSGLSGVSVSLGGASSQTVSTNSSGQFSFSNVPNGTYTVTPTLAGYTFNPASQSISVNGGNVNSVSFSATAQTFSIAGTITRSTGGGLANVAVTLGGSSGTIQATTDGSGNFLFSGIANGTYTLTPVLNGYTFSPASRSVAVSGANQSGMNFVGTANPAPTFAISGTVSTSSGGLSGATITLQGSSGSTATTTDASGNYSFSGVADGTYTVLASRTGYTITPSSQSVTVSGANRTGINFSATLITYTITGTITSGGTGLSGVTVSLSGAATQSTTTNTSGQYAFTGVANGTYTVTPSRSGYTFSPTNQSVTVSGANRTGISFTSTLITYSLTGTVSGPTGALVGVTMSLSGPSGTQTATTNSSGQYSFSGLVNGTYTVTPTLGGVVFTPVNRSVTVSGASVGSVNFSGSQVVYSVTLAWDAVTQNADGTPATNLGGYRIYYGTSSGNYGANVSAGNVTQFTVNGLTAGIYYFAVKAYNTAGDESAFSNEVNNGPMASVREFMVAVPSL